ncbi:MAG: histidine phosphatase family protein [Candidatus Omnitrophota bacterium]|nr:histidine phosphatase family protein [Candidatus Omnitrophota bacterium]
MKKTVTVQRSEVNQGVIPAPVFTGVNSSGNPKRVDRMDVCLRGHDKNGRREPPEAERLQKTTFILIRHGITTHNLKKRYSGSTDVKLSLKGKKQAVLLGKKLKSWQIDEVYSSNRMRSLQTARIIFKNRKIKKIADLREINFGIFEGRSYSEIISTHAQVYGRWLKDPFKTNIPKGEALQDFKKRVLAIFKKITAVNAGKNIAVVCHGGVISIFLSAILKSRDFWKNIPDSASITIIEHNKGKQKIKLQNDTSHLNG